MDERSTEALPEAALDREKDYTLVVCVSVYGFEVKGHHSQVWLTMNVKNVLSTRSSEADIRLKRIWPQSYSSALEADVEMFLNRICCSSAQDNPRGLCLCKIVKRTDIQQFYPALFSANVCIFTAGFWNVNHFLLRGFDEDKTDHFNLRKTLPE